MRTIETTVYTFDELSDDAKARAREWYLSDGDYWDSSDWWNSAQAFCRIAPIDITSATYDNAQVDYRWTGDESVRELSGLRAWKWLQNNGWFEWATRENPGACTLTGFCGDASFSDPLYGYATHPAQVPTVEQVFYECAQAWVREARGDLEGASEDDYVDETILANEYEFDVNGKPA